MQIVMAVPVRVLHYLLRSCRKVTSAFLLRPETFSSVCNTQLHIKIKTMIFNCLTGSSELNGVVFNLCFAKSVTLGTEFKCSCCCLLEIKSKSPRT